MFPEPSLQPIRRHACQVLAVGDVARPPITRGFVEFPLRRSGNDLPRSSIRNDKTKFDEYLVHHADRCERPSGYLGRFQLEAVRTVQPGPLFPA